MTKRLTSQNFHYPSSISANPTFGPKLALICGEKWPKMSKNVLHKFNRENCSFDEWLFSGLAPQIQNFEKHKQRVLLLCTSIAVFFLLTLYVVAK